MVVIIYLIFVQYMKYRMQISCSTAFKTWSVKKLHEVYTTKLKQVLKMLASEVTISSQMFAPFIGNFINDSLLQPYNDTTPQSAASSVADVMDLLLITAACLLVFVVNRI